MTYKLQLNYAPLGYTPHYATQDTITYTALLNLYTQHSITCTQPNATTLEFDSNKDRTLAVLALSAAKEYTCECVD